MFSMKKYRYTQHGLGHITVGDKEYMLEHGDEIELPEDDAKVKELVGLGYLVGIDKVTKEEPAATSKRKLRKKTDSSTEVNGANATEGDADADAGKQ